MRDQVGALAVPYLHSACPRELQHAAECVLRALEQNGEGDAVWLLLCQISHHEITSPASVLKQYKHQELHKVQFFNVGCFGNEMKTHAQAIVATLT